ncbi:hypothetical protein ABER68_00795 [Paenibacillus alvei]
MTGCPNKDNPHIVQLAFSAEDTDYEGLLREIAGIKVSEKTSVVSEGRELEWKKYKFSILSYLNESI